MIRIQDPIFFSQIDMYCRVSFLSLSLSQLSRMKTANMAKSNGNRLVRLVESSVCEEVFILCLMEIFFIY